MLIVYFIYMISKYADLTIKQFLNCKLISEMEKDPIDRNVRLLAEISGKSVDEIESLPITELKAKLKYLSNLETLDEVGKVRMKFKVKNKWFKVIWKTQELTSAQYIDVSHFTKEPDKILYNIHNILAAICVPMKWGLIKQKYDGAKHKEIADLLYNHMTIQQAYPIMLFFCKYFEELEAATLTYLVQEGEKTLKEAERIFTQNTVG
jgi:hypothetical protein